MKISIMQPQVIQELGNRSNQEDSVYPRLNEATLEDRVFVLCDGMGGHENGEVASQLVCDVLPSSIKDHWDGGQFSDSIFQDALDEVYNRINEYQSDSLRRMGTTLTFICIHKGGVTMAHIGDSRIYHVRPSEHLIIYKSRDHSLAYDMFLAGEISFEELTTHKKNVITRAVMPGQETPFKADIAHTADVKTGDYFVLCSDGMLEQMTDVELTELLSSDLTNEQKREQLIERTKENKDNHSAIMIQISDVEVEMDDALLMDDESHVNCNAILLERQARKKNLSNKCNSEVSPKQNPISKAIMSFMKRILLLLVLVLPFAPMQAVNVYDNEKAQQYLHEADYYNKKADNYEREAQYYHQKAEGYIRQADYYTKRKDSSRARSYTSRANDAFGKAQLRMKWAKDAREKAQLRLKWAKQASRQESLK